MGTKGTGAEQPTGPKRPHVFSTVRRLLGGIAKAAPWLTSPRFLMGAALVAIIIGVMGAAFGYVASERGLPSYVKANVVAPAVSEVRHWLHQPQEAHWDTLTAHLGALESVRVSVSEADAGPMAALEEMDGHLVFMTQRGALSYLNTSKELHSLDIDVPMNIAALRARAIPGLDYGFDRALDLLAVETAPHKFDLYASFDRFNAAQTCFQVVVSRMRMTTTKDGVLPQSGWEDLFATKPCVPPRITEGVFIGIQSGGRLVRYDDHTLLLSVGDLEFDGVKYPGMTTAPDGPQDPSWDLGKIIAINLATGTAEHWAMGFRNPQGLLVDGQGRIWETEHGPRGGDEINLIQPGGNYGWPIVTYGMRYSAKIENWPRNPTFGGHTGYDLPAYVFVPSVGISQIIQPSAKEFPFWYSTLLVTSLAGRTLYEVRLEGDRAMYARPMRLGERLRDIISRRNGEIAIISDTGFLFLIRAQTNDSHGGTFSITDRRTLKPSPRVEQTPADAGRQLFAENCKSCHDLADRVRVGPPLNGVVGRDIASAQFAYSPVLRDADGVWNAKKLTAFLTEPERQFSGTAMPDPQMTGAQARNLIAFLQTTGKAR